ncbi:nucleoside deaminase [Arthrobacter yangruifuii]|uniref:nucleoside deaminase n=1 Tax=Arthrobacter yangruifuii TaxID=2606616 RepID=UPI0011B4B704|nr:nucleoside deaminase [Arthrobacter yangruifuii]
MNTTSDSMYLARAIQLATENVADGGGPFGAVVVTAEGAAFEGVNRVTANNDPTAHAEVTAIRNACATLGTFDLTGAVLYTSCEPCPMCLASSLWARVGRVVYAADRHDAARAGFDDAAFYEYFETPLEQRSLQVTQLAVEDSPAMAPFDAWTAAAARIDY